MSFDSSPIEPDGLLDGLQWSSILRGAILDHVLSLAAMIPLYLRFDSDAFSEDAASAERAMERLFASSEFLFWSAAVGLAITVYAGLWVSRRAGALHLRHGGWTAATALVLGTLFLLLPGANEGPAPPLWYETLGVVLMVPAGVLGGWIARALSDRSA